jgi:hypothetical protein
VTRDAAIRCRHGLCYWFSLSKWKSVVLDADGLAKRHKCAILRARVRIGTLLTQSENKKCGVHD